MDGDWIKCPEHPAVYQEKAVVTGALAANEILRREGLEEVKIIAPFADDWTIALLRFLGKGVRKPLDAATRLASGWKRSRALRNGFGWRQRGLE